MSLERYLGDGQRSSGLADELRAAAPTISALARLCGSALCYELEPRPPLSLEAEAILFAARKCGSFELKVSQPWLFFLGGFRLINVFQSKIKLKALRGDLPTRCRHVST